jgi:glutathione S-transferase
MTEYTLYYWPAPFRGQFIRAVLAHIGADWREADIDDLITQKDADPDQQLIPHMGPPVLTDHGNNVTLAQTQAILTYLGNQHDLIPTDPLRTALTAKIIADANDVLYEMTRYNGAQMWTDESWQDYQPRLCRWMAMFEVLGTRHGLGADQGHMLGTEKPGIADFVAYVLWGVMTAKFPALSAMLDQNAPAIAALVDRIGSLEAQKNLTARSDAQYGTLWCGGQIEASLRRVL